MVWCCAVLCRPNQTDAKCNGIELKFSFSIVRPWTDLRRGRGHRSPEEEEEEDDDDEADNEREFLVYFLFLGSVSFPLHLKRVSLSPLCLFESSMPAWSF